MCASRSLSFLIIIPSIFEDVGFQTSSAKFVENILDPIRIYIKEKKKTENCTIHLWRTL